MPFPRPRLNPLELMMAAAVIGLLAWLVGPAIRSRVGAGDQTDALRSLRAVMTAFEMYRDPALK